APVAALHHPWTNVREDEEIDLPSFMDMLLNARHLILGTTVLALAIGACYAFLSQPVYRADALIQVEPPQQRQAEAHVLAELSSVFNVQATATAEMELLRSRLVVGEATDEIGRASCRERV